MNLSEFKRDKNFSLQKQQQKNSKNNGNLCIFSEEKQLQCHEIERLDP